MTHYYIVVINPSKDKEVTGLWENNSNVDRNIAKQIFQTAVKKTGTSRLRGVDAFLIETESDFSQAKTKIKTGELFEKENCQILEFFQGAKRSLFHSILNNKKEFINRINEI